MTTRYFSAIVEAGDGRGYGIFFPDLPGCVSAGDTIQEAARNAEDALALHVAGMIEDGETVPDPRELDAISVDPEVREAARILVRVDLPNRAVRLNISMDEGLVAAVDRTAQARGLSRSAFLAEAARAVLSRRT